MNPGKIVDPPKMDDRSLFRFKPGYRPSRLETALTGPIGAVSPARSRCATTTAPAGNPCRRDVPVLPGDRGRAAPDPRARQLPAPGPVGPAWRRTRSPPTPCRHHGALRRLQGLQAGMPDRRRHGADEDREVAQQYTSGTGCGSGPLIAYSAALCADGVTYGRCDELARHHSRPREIVRSRVGLFGKAHAAEVAP